MTRDEAFNLTGQEREDFINRALGQGKYYRLKKPGRRTKIPKKDVFIEYFIYWLGLTLIIGLFIGLWAFQEAVLRHHGLELKAWGGVLLGFAVCNAILIKFKQVWEWANHLGPYSPFRSGDKDELQRLQDVYLAHELMWQRKKPLW